MKRNEAIDNAFKAGFELVNGSIHVDGVDVTDEIVLLANIIEQATLEMAAKECEAISAFLFSPTEAAGATCCADRLRALKDSHE